MTHQWETEWIMRVRLQGGVNLAEIIENVVEDAIRDVSLQSLGADGDSEYEVEDVIVTFDAMASQWVAEVSVTHVSGKFAPKSDVVEAFIADVEGYSFETELADVEEAS